MGSVGFEKEALGGMREAMREDGWWMGGGWRGRDGFGKLGR